WRDARNAPRRRGPPAATGSKRQERARNSENDARAGAGCRGAPVGGDPGTGGRVRAWFRVPPRIPQGLHAPRHAAGRRASPAFPLTLPSSTLPRRINQSKSVGTAPVRVIIANSYSTLTLTRARPGVVALAPRAIMKADRRCGCGKEVLWIAQTNL